MDIAITHLCNTNWKLYACGDFTSYNGTACDEVVRIKCGTGAGTLDNDILTGFNMAGNGPNGANNGPVWCMKKQDDAKIIIGGKFTYYNTTAFPALNVTRILPVSGAPTGEAKNGVIVYESEPEIDIFNKDVFVLYPNPTTGILNFTTDIFRNTAFSIQIYNTLGQLVVSKQNMTQNDTSIDVGNLVGGNYFIVFSNNEKTITKTIIVNKN